MTTTTEIKEHPILFTDEMVRAILAGRKTQTRRVVKHQDSLEFLGCVGDDRNDPTMWGWRADGNGPDEYCTLARGEFDCWARCPYGKPGDRLVVREAFQYADWTDDGDPYIRYRADGEVRLCQVSEEWVERAGDIWAKLSARDNYAIDGKAADRCWRPNIFMPRWACRLTPEITEVRIQRLHDITQSDADAEGGTTGRPFGTIWRQINTKPGIRWDDNPWVWAVAFRRVDA